MKKTAVIALILTFLCAAAHGQKIEYPVDVYIVSNANIYLSADPTNSLENRLDYLEGLGTSSQGVTNPAIVLTDGSRAMLLVYLLNTNSLGSELLSNNDFSGSPENWALTNCEYVGNAITITGATTATLTFTNTIAVSAYKSFQVGLELLGTGPVVSLTYAFAGKTGTASSISTGVYRFGVTAELTNGLRFTIVTTNGLKIDNASVKIINDGDGVFGDQITAGGNIRAAGQFVGPTISNIEQSVSTINTQALRDIGALASNAVPLEGGRAMTGPFIITNDNQIIIYDETDIHIIEANGSQLQLNGATFLTENDLPSLFRLVSAPLSNNASGSNGHMALATNYLFYYSDKAFNGASGGWNRVTGTTAWP